MGILTRLFLMFSLVFQISFCTASNEGNPLLPPEDVPYPFLTFDNLIYTGKPDISGYGFLPVIINGTAFWSGSWPNYDMSEPYQPAVEGWAANLDPNKLIVPDIEHWPLKASTDGSAAVDESMAKLIQIVDWMRAVNPDLIIGYYGTPPISSYWSIYQYLDALELQGTPAWSPWYEASLPGFQNSYVTWQADTAYLSPLADKMDVILPSLYTFYEDQHGWEVRGKGLLEGAKTYGKPVYAYIWPQYHDSTPLSGQHVTGQYWRRQLEVCRRYADGAVLWGGWQYPWNENADWWQETILFMQRNQNTVDARTAGAVLNGVSDDRALLQSIIDNFPVSGGRLLLDGPAGIGGAGLHIQNKNNVVIQGMTENAALVALPGSQPPMVGNSPVLVKIENADHAAVEYLTIDLKNQPIGGIGVINSKYVVIHKNNINNIAASGQQDVNPTGIVGISNQNNDYTENKITGAYAGIALTNLPGEDPETHATLSKNFINDMSDHGISLTGLRASANQNLIWDIAKTGFSMINPVQSGDIMQIVSNIVTNAGEYGFLIQRTDGGPSASGLEFDKNTSQNNGKDGLLVSQINNLKIRNNFFYSNGTAANPAYGVHVKDSNDVNVLSNDAKDLRGASTKGQLTGIRILAEDKLVNGQPQPVHLSNISVTDNDANLNKEDGIDILSTGNSTLDHVTLNVNTLQQNNRYGIYINGLNQGISDLLVYLNTYISNTVAALRNENYAGIKPLIEVYPNAMAGKFDIYGTPLDGTESYELQLSPTPDFAALTYASSYPQHPHTVSLPYNGHYYVRIRGKTILDNIPQFTQWSQTAEISQIAGAELVVETKFLKFKNVVNSNRGETAPISFSVKEAGHVAVTIYDRTGREIAKPMNADLTTGTHTAPWDGRNTEGDLVASGVYTAVLKANDRSDKTKIVILK